MSSNASFNKLNANEALIDDLTVNNLTINNRNGSINHNDTTIISKSKKVKCTLEEIVDNLHVVIKATDGELLYCASKKNPDTTYLSKTFYGNLYYRFVLKTCVKSDNGRYSILTIDSKTIEEGRNLVYDWFQETYLIVHSNNINFLHGFEHRYNLELLPYYCMFDTSLTQSSNIDNTEVHIVHKVKDKHYIGIINNNNVYIKIDNDKILNANDYFGKTINIPLIRKALINNISLHDKSFIYDNKNYNTIIPLYHIHDNMSLFTEELNNRTIVATRNEYLKNYFQLDIKPDLTKINVIMFDVYCCTEIIMKSNDGNFIMIFSYENSDKYVFYDKHKKSFIIVHLRYNISDLQEDRDKIGYSFIMNKLYRLHYADSYNFNDGNYTLNNINGNYVTLKNNKDNSIVAIRNDVFDLTNNLYGKILNFTFIPYFEYIYKH
uniref:Uncharacterized protein n=1 Tax=viral metagenome TaxID=1070528 RepID=A0A6C0LGD1_9ZZZZ